MKAIFRHGSPRMVDYTPTSGDVSAGDVIVVGKSVRIAHSDIKEGQLGAVAISGGVYDFVKDTGEGEAIGVAALLHWDASEGEATDTATDNAFIGPVVEAAGDDDEYVRAYHTPIAPEPGTS